MATYKNETQYYQRFQNPAPTYPQSEVSNPRLMQYNNPPNNGLRVQMQVPDTKITPLMMKYNRGSNQ
jgi:hypothetical protein